MVGAGRVVDAGRQPGLGWSLTAAWVFQKWFSETETGVIEVGLVLAEGCFFTGKCAARAREGGTMRLVTGHRVGV